MKESKFTGGLLGLIGINLLAILITLCTAFIALPWAVCMKYEWVADHTYIDGKQLKFDGHGIQLMAKYIWWLLLTIVTCGIYSFWLVIKVKQWVTKHTHFLNK